MNTTKLIKDSFLVGCGYGLLLSSILGFSVWIRPFFETANLMSLFFALWYAILTPILGAFFFGIPWVLTCALSAYSLYLSLTTRKQTSLLLNTLIGTFVSTLGGFVTYLIYLKPLIVSQRTCDSICLGLEKEWILGTPLWILILIAFTSIGSIQSIVLAHRNRGEA